MDSSSRPWHRVLRLGLPIIGGAVAGLGATLFWRPPPQVHANEPAPAAAEPRVRIEPGASPGPDERRLAALEAKLAALEQQSTVSAEADADTAESRQRPSGQGPKERMEKRVADHSAEPVEAAWSAKTSTMLRSDIREIAAGSRFRVVNVDCRTTLCLARVEWESLGAASDEYARLMHYPYRANCAKSVAVDEQPNPNGSVGASVLFECEDWRGSGEEEGHMAPTYR